MKTTILLSGLILFAANTAFAQAPATSEAGKPAEAAKSGGKLSCDQLKQDIEAKFAAHGVKQFSLEIVDAAQESSGKILGHCDGGTHKLVYTKGAPPAK